MIRRSSIVVTEALDSVTVRRLTLAEERGGVVGIALHAGSAESGDSEEVVGGSEKIGMQLDAVETAIARMAHAGLNIDEYYRPDE